jgi:hypothetical protein
MMGAWGTGSFENDDAADWISDFSTTPNRETLVEALTTVAEFAQEDYLDLRECGPAIAAAEVVAALQGHPHPELPDDVVAWVKHQPQRIDDRLVDLALRAIERVATNSEMQELWEETNYAAEWKIEMDDLKRRLNI